MANAHPISVRIPPHLMTAIDAHIARLGRAKPGTTITRTDAMLDLIEQAAHLERARERRQAVEDRSSP